MYQNELWHHGVKGQRWGFRRYQNKDGSLTPAGRKRAEKLKSKYLEVTGKQLKGRALSTKGKTNVSSDKENKKLTLETMSNDQIKEFTNRLRLQNDLTRELNTYKSLHPKTVSKGRKFVEHSWSKVIAPAATEAGKKVFSSWLEKTGKDLLGLNPAQQKDVLGELRKEVESLELQKRKKKAEDYLNGKTK